MIQLTSKKDNNTIVGLEIEGGSIAAAQVRSNGRPQLMNTAIGVIDPEIFHEGEVKDSERLAEVLRDFFAENKLSRRVRIGVANQGVVVRTLRLPAIDDPAEMANAVRFKAQEQIPMPLDQAVLDHRVVGGVASRDDSAPQVDVIVVAARRDMVTSMLQPLRRARLEPVGVDLSAFGMIRALGHQVVAMHGQDADSQSPVTSATLYCHVGSITNLAVAKGRACLFTRVSPVGLEGVASDLAQSSGLTHDHALMWLQHVGLDTPVEQIEGDPAIVAAARTSLEAGASSLVDALRLSLDYYRTQEGALPVDGVVLCGPGSAIPGVDKWMNSVLQLPFEIGRPDALADLDDASSARLTLSYGLALES